MALGILPVPLVIAIPAECEKAGAATEVSAPIKPSAVMVKPTVAPLVKLKVKAKPKGKVSKAVPWIVVGLIAWRTFS